MFRGFAHRLNLFAYSMRAVGTGRMLRHSIDWIRDAEARNFDSGFDERFGTDTNGDMTPGEAGIPTGRRREAVMYLPTMDQDLASMLGGLAWSAGLRRHCTFVDFGSGKGRAVFLAAMHGFREVVGVELSRVLHETAEENLQLMRSADVLDSPVSLVHADATTYDVPSTPLVIYMYHPFKGEVARVVLRRLRESIAAAPRRAAILYCHPKLQASLERELFEEEQLFELSAHGTRHTRRLRTDWSVFTNDAWLEERSCSRTS